MLIPVPMQHVKTQVLVHQCYVGHPVHLYLSVTRDMHALVTERHLSMPRVNFVRVFLDNLGYFGDPGHGEPDHIVCAVLRVQALSHGILFV